MRDQLSRDTPKFMYVVTWLCDWCKKVVSEENLLSPEGEDLCAVCVKARKEALERVRAERKAAAK